jgi:hypothetical protein
MFKRCCSIVLFVFLFTTGTAFASYIDVDTLTVYPKNAT